jgi:hypothetical protein
MLYLVLLFGAADERCTLPSFAFRNPQPAGVRQSKSARQFLYVPQFDQSVFVFGWHRPVHQTPGAVSQ